MSKKCKNCGTMLDDDALKFNILGVALKGCALVKLNGRLDHIDKTGRVLE